jgi:uncharacterized protein
VKRSFFTLIPLFFVLVFFLGGCAPANTSLPTPVVNTPATSATKEPTVVTNPKDELSEEDINEIVNRILARLELEAGEPASSDIVGLAGVPDIDTDYRGFVDSVSSKLDKYWNTIFTISDQANEYTKPQIIVPSTGTIKFGPNGDLTRAADEGPFYYSSTKSIYLPLPDLYTRLLGIEDKHTDFAGAFIIAHEWGHHIQEIVGIMKYANEQKAQASSKEIKNYISQKVELQADCLAGTWANSEYYQGTLSPGDIEEAISLAIAIGDDVLTGKTDPADMEHGTGELRKSWFMYGYNYGDPLKCGEVWGASEQVQAKTTTPAAPQPENPQKSDNQDSLITSFFVLASDKSCEIIDDYIAITLTTLECTFSDGGNTIIVYYDEWVGEQAWLSWINLIRENDNPVFDSTWQADGTGAANGPYVVWLTEKNKATIIWGVNSQRISGTVFWYNNDVEAAQKWFFSQGSRHYTTSQPQPTQPPVKQTPSTTLTDFWVYASDRSCQLVEDTSTDTMETIRCAAENGTIQVDYDLWITEKSILDAINNLRSDGVLNMDETWKSNSSEHRGELVSWKLQDGRYILMWTVSAHRFTGQAVGNDLDQLNQWFTKEGGRHYTK